ncbi:MAG: 16S rRNA (guanine(966)-N(2))-methyltransferase RsmD [Clostridia bacterium]|nr:16S rRNA (guanine(966)-N(2))-methyltransferase RsmD [Clostridia bacterium]
MRVITGKYRNLRLSTPANNRVRPTSDKVKEAIFSSIQFNLPNAYFLDLFSGTGQMGIEALSRGAKKSVFVDKNLSLVRENLSKIKDINHNSDYSLLECDVLNSIKLCKNQDLLFDIVFMDPPYNSSDISDILKELSQILAPDAVVVCEHSSTISLPECVSCLSLKQTRKYSSTTVTTYLKNSI